MPLTDTPHLPQAGSLRPAEAGTRAHPGSITRWVVVGTVLALLVAWGAVAAALMSMRRDALQADREHRVNLARTLQEQTVRVLAATDQATRRLSDAVRAGGMDVGDIGRYANETGLAPLILTQLSLVGPDGRFRGSNLDPDGSRSGHVDLSSREHVKVHLNPGQAKDAPPVSADGLFIGKPVLGKVSGKWTIQLSRRIEALDGRVLGVVVASLDPLYFEDTYRGVVLGMRGEVSLVGSDMTLRARVVGGHSSGMGKRFEAVSTIPFTADSGDFDSVDAASGSTLRFVYRQVAGYPLYVAVARSEREALESWDDSRVMALALTALLTAALIGAAAIFALAVRRLEATNLALQESEAKANAANQAKTQFLAAISHELRTPLTSIRGFAELMELRLQEQRFREQAGLIRKAAEYLNELLTEILDLVKVEAGAMQVERREVALRPLVDGVASFFAVTAADKGLQLSVHIPDELRAAVMADELRVKQILNNLLSNAFKFTEGGSVTIEADGDSRHVRLHVVDTGPGIAPHLHEVIFERFRQGDAKVSYQHGGTGLGLALSRALAELMGGTLTVESSVGVGSRFTLTLPTA